MPAPGLSRQRRHREAPPRLIHRKRFPLSRVGALAAPLLVLIVAALMPFRATAALHTGTAGLFSGDGWDFSDSLVTGAVSGADIVFDVTALGSTKAIHSALTDRLFAISPGAILYIGSADNTYENLLSAPTDPDLYGTSEVAVFLDVFVVRTREGHYAKIRILPFGPLLNFEYTYQDDGSPSFVPSVTVRTTTWGRIRALYRH